MCEHISKKHVGFSIMGDMEVFWCSECAKLIEIVFSLQKGEEINE